MRAYRGTLGTAFAAVALILSLPNTPSASEGLYFVTATNWILAASTDTPGVVLTSAPITGLESGESILAVDARSSLADGALYLLGSSSRLYVMDKSNLGKVTAVGGAFSSSLFGAEFGFDFDPAQDVIRVISDAGQNLRIDPNTGQVLAVDPGPIYVDARDEIEPSLVAAAYASDMGSVTPKLFLIDAGLDLLVAEDGTAPGRVIGVGPLGVDATEMLGFDISNSTGLAYAALNVGGRTGLYRIDLESGSASVIGELGSEDLVRAMGLSVGPIPVPIVRVSWGEVKADYRNP